MDTIAAIRAGLDAGRRVDDIATELGVTRDVVLSVVRFDSIARLAAVAASGGPDGAYAGAVLAGRVAPDRQV